LLYPHSFPTRRSSDLASPVLLDLRRNALERVDLSVFDDLRLVYASRLQSKRETFFATLVGHSVPTFCTAGGRAILSHLPGAEVEDRKSTRLNSSHVKI